MGLSIATVRLEVIFKRKRSSYVVVRWTDSQMLGLTISPLQNLIIKSPCLNTSPTCQIDHPRMRVEPDRSTPTNELDRSSNHSRGTKPKRSKPRSSSIHSFLEKESRASSNATPPLDEISLSSGISSHSNSTDLTSCSKEGRAGKHRRPARRNSNRSTVSLTSSACGSILNEVAFALDHSSIVTVNQLWEKVKRVETYKEDIPEQCILRMLEIDPKTRKHLRLSSLRSPRYEKLCKTLIYIVESIISFLGPDLEEFIEEVYSIGELCAKEGINPRLLGEATLSGVVHLLGELSPCKEKAWKSTFDFLATKMADCSWTDGLGVTL